MSFDCVPNIHTLVPYRRIQATFRAPYDDDSFYQTATKSRIFNPALIGESVGQLLSFLVMASTDFQRQALFFGVEDVRYPHLEDTAGDLKLAHH